MSACALPEPLIGAVVPVCDASVPLTRFPALAATPKAVLGQPQLKTPDFFRPASCRNCRQTSSPVGVRGAEQAAIMGKLDSHKAAHTSCKAGSRRWCSIFLQNLCFCKRRMTLQAASWPQKRATKIRHLQESRCHNLPRRSKKAPCFMRSLVLVNPQR